MNFHKGHEKKKKKPCSTGEQIPKSGRSGEFFFFYRTDPKSACKSKTFPLTSLAFFRKNFCSKKWLILSYFFVKKKKFCKWAKKRSVGPVEQGFFFSWPNQNIWFLLWSLEIKQAQNNTIKGCVNNFIGQFCIIYAHATSTIIIKLHYPMKNTISNFHKECWGGGVGLFRKHQLPFWPIWYINEHSCFFYWHWQTGSFFSKI